MSNITQYTKDNQIFYSYKIQKFCAYTSGASGASDMSGASGCSGASCASGASGYYIDETHNVTVEKLSIYQLAGLIKSGEIKISEVEKWCKSKNVSYEITENGDLNCLSFKYNKKQYSLSCNKELDITDSDEKPVVKTRTQNFSDGSYSIYEMDAKGRDLKRTDYNEKGSLQGTLEFTYNNDGTVIQTSKNAVGTITQITNVDAKGNVTHNSWFNEDGSLRETADYERDKNGVETTITKDADGTIRHKFVYDWTNNKRISSETYDKNSNLVQYEKYEYDALGALTTTTYNSDNKRIGKTVHNPNGRLSTISEYNDNEQETVKRHFGNNCKEWLREETSYNENGHVNGHVMTWYNDDGTVSGKRIYEFGGNGQIVNGNLVGVTAIHQYWYDSNGNITKEEHNEVKTDLQKFEERLNGNEFDRDVDCNELWQKIEEYKNLVIEDFKNNASFPEGLKDILSNYTPPNLINTIFSSLSTKYGNAKSARYFVGTLNLKEILTVLKQSYDELIKTPSTECNSEYFGRTIGNATHDFVSSMLQRVYYQNKENLSIPDVFKFEDLLIQYIAENYGMVDDLQRNEYINFANIPDENDNGNWIDDLYNIANNFALLFDKLYLIGYTTISVETLFNDKDELSISGLIEKLRNKYLFIKDAGLNKFGVMINNVLDKFNISNDYDKEDLIKSVVILMNKAAGVQNSYPVMISRDTIEQLNEKGIFDKLDIIINGDELRDLYYFGVDGYIDNYNQGNTGDCWLIAAISALDATESGQQGIKDSISQDKNGNIAVTFRGIGISYTITPEEMVEARDVFAYSNGDNDVQALELATEKLRRDITAGKINLRYGNYGGGNDDDGSYGMGINGGLQYNMLYYLTGNIPLVELSYPNSETDVIEFLNSMYNDFKTGNYAGYFSLGDKNVQATTINNITFNWYEAYYHAFSILSMSENTITIANPWYPDKPYTFFWEEFAKLLPYDAGLVSTVVHEHEYKTTYGNTIDFDSTFTINRKEYSLNDILSSEEAIFYETNDINDYKNNDKIKNILINIAFSALSDIKPEIVDNLIEDLAHYYCILLDKLDYDDIWNTDYMGVFVPVNSSIANELGVYQTENGGVVDIRGIVQKMLETLEYVTREPMTLEEYEDKLQGNEFDKEVSTEELNSYLNEYRELLINDMKSNYDYDEEYIRLFDNFIREKISDIEYNSNINGKFNLKEMLNSIKKAFNELQNVSSQECQTAALGYSTNNNVIYFSCRIISDVYYNNVDYIDTLGQNEFQEQLIRYIAEKYGKSKELEETGSLDLSKLIQDTNGDNNWLYEFFSIVNEFSHKDDNKVYSNKIDYDAEFEYNGKKYTFNDILSSSEQVFLNIDKEEYAYHYVDLILYKLKKAMHDIQPKLRNSIIEILHEYYFRIASLCFNEDAYNNGTDMMIVDASTKNIDFVHFDSTVAENYGITKTDDGVQISVKVIIQKILEFIK